MTETIAKVCFERIVPPQYWQVARDKAIKENPRNASPFEAAALRSKLWKPGRLLRIKFLDGRSSVQAKVADYAVQWCQHANINFEFTDDPQADAEIRISFNYPGSWSAVGTDALVEELFPKNEPTMNFGWLTPASTEAEYSAVVLHEFGHALGMIHEHQTPASQIEWNRDAVIADLSGYPNYWNEPTIQRNVFDRYLTTQTQFTKFDPDSIMVYTIPRHWTLKALEFKRNMILSESDKAFIKQCYP